MDLFLPTSGDRQPSYGAMVERRDGPSWLRNDDDDEVLCAVTASEWSLMYIRESRAVAEKPHDAVVKLDSYRNLRQHHAVLLR